MPHDYLNLKLNDDIKSLAEEYAYLDKEIQAIDMALNGSIPSGYENILLQMYLHATRGQVILKRMESKLTDFTKEL